MSITDGEPGFFFAHEVKAKSAPVFLNALLHDAFIPGGHDIPMEYPWQQPGFVPETPDPPDELWLISADRSYDFDLRTYMQGYVVTTALVDALRLSLAEHWSVSSLHVVNRRGDPITTRPYSFIKPRGEAILDHAVDRAHSELICRDNGEIKEVRGLALSPPKDIAVFTLKEIALLGVLFFDHEAAQALSDLPLHGVAVQPIEQIASAKPLWAQ